MHATLLSESPHQPNITIDQRVCLKEFRHHKPIFQDTNPIGWMCSGLADMWPTRPPESNPPGPVSAPLVDAVQEWRLGGQARVNSLDEESIMTIGRSFGTPVLGNALGTPPSPYDI